MNVNAHTIANINGTGDGNAMFLYADVFIQAVNVNLNLQCEVATGANTEH